MAFTKEDWWHTDKTGRRIGWMWPEDFVSILESFYGEKRWVHSFSYECGFARSTIDRWKEGTMPIPKHVALIVRLLGDRKNAGGANDIDIKAPWLPDVEGANARLGPPILVAKAKADAELKVKRPGRPKKA